MFYISYTDRPDDVLFSLRSAGDVVKIGRDKRVCKICLGVNAQGVSRVHMSIELKQQGSRLILLSKDISTYGSGYNGGPLIVGREERELHVGDTLQIGNFSFTIGKLRAREVSSDDDVAVIPTKENIHDEVTNTRRVIDSNGRKPTKRSSVNEDLVLTKRSKNSELYSYANSSELCERSGTKMFTGKVVDGDRGRVCARFSFLDDVCAETQTQSEVAPRVVVNSACGTQSSADSQRESCSSGSVASRPRLLPSDDEYSDETNSARLATNHPNVLAEDSSDEGDSSQNRQRIVDDDVKSVVADSVVCGDDNDYESNRNNSFRIDSNRFPSSNHQLSGILNGEDGLHDVRGNASLEDSIVAGAANRSRIADLETQCILNPISHSTQRDGTNFTQRYGCTKDVRDFGNQRNASVTTSKRRKDVREAKIASTGVEGQLPKRRGRPPKSSRNDVESDNALQLTSLKNTIDRIDASIGEMQNEVEGIRSKRIKLEPIDVEEDGNDSCDKENGIDKDVDDVKMEGEQQDDNLIIGLDIETLRRKLAKVVEYSDLEKRKPHQTQIPRNSSTNYDGICSMTTSTLIIPNVKRFKKAPQGCYSQKFPSRYQPITQIIGRTDMVDFRELKAMTI